MYFFKKKYIYICINTPVTYDKELFCLTQRCFFGHLDLSPYFGNCIFQCPIMLTVYFSCPSTPKFYIIWPCLKAKLIVILIKSHSVDKNVFFWNFGKIDNLVSIVWTFRCFLCISDVVKVSSRPIHFSNTDCMRIKKKICGGTITQGRDSGPCAMLENHPFDCRLKDSHDRLLTSYILKVLWLFFWLSIVLNLKIYLDLIMQGQCIGIFLQLQVSCRYDCLYVNSDKLWINFFFVSLNDITCPVYSLFFFPDLTQILLFFFFDSSNGGVCVLKWLISTVNLSKRKFLRKKKKPRKMNKKKRWPFVFKRFKLWGRSKRKIELSESLIISPFCKQNLWI